MMTLIRLKSDNYDTYVTPAAYREITLRMSTGDHATHRTRTITVDADLYDLIKWHGNKGLIDIEERNDYYDEDDRTMLVWVMYDGQGDCFFEPVE